MTFFPLFDRTIPSPETFESNDLFFVLLSYQGFAVPRGALKNGLTKATEPLETPLVAKDRKKWKLQRKRPECILATKANFNHSFVNAKTCKKVSLVSLGQYKYMSVYRDILQCHMYHMQKCLCQQPQAKVSAGERLDKIVSRPGMKLVELCGQENSSECYYK